MGFALTGLALPGATAPAFDAQGRYWAHVAAGFDHTSGIGTSGTQWCWSGNDHGQLGIRPDTNQSGPQQVTSCRQLVVLDTQQVLFR